MQNVGANHHQRHTFPIRDVRRLPNYPKEQKAPQEIHDRACPDEINTLLLDFSLEWSDGRNTNHILIHYYRNRRNFLRKFQEKSTGMPKLVLVYAVSAVHVQFNFWKID